MGIQIYIESGSRVTLDELMELLPTSRATQEVLKLRQAATDQYNLGLKTAAETCLYLCRSCAKAPVSEYDKHAIKAYANADERIRSLMIDESGEAD